MHDFSLFLLKNWLPVGIAAILFFSIGLLLAKFIWGRFNQRLSFAVEENLNLASQWSALGSSQRDLFKKLRARWQADRDAWENRISESEREVLTTSARIEQLTSQLKGSGKAIPAAPVIDERDREKIVKLEALLEEKSEELEAVRNEAHAEVISPIVAAEIGEIDLDAPDRFQQRIQELEQDLIDTHDELHSIRSDYDKQLELIESLENQLIEVPEQEAEIEDNQLELMRVSDKLAESTEQAETAKRTLAQLNAILSWKNRDTITLRSGLSNAATANRELESKLVEEQDRSEFDAQIEALESALEEAKNDLGSRSEESDEKTTVIESLSKEIEANGEEIGALNTLLEEALLTERRKTLLQANLNDACHEMYDVRSALNDRLDEVELLEARLDELDEVEDEKKKLTSELALTENSLKEIHAQHSDAQENLKMASGQNEELEAIIGDRSAEVEDLSTEVRQQRDKIRKLKSSLAVLEGEMEALSGESATVMEASEAKNAMIEARTQRITNLEIALAGRYEEMNSVRMGYDDELKSARYHASRADQLEAELQRRAAAFEESGIIAATAEEALEQSNQQIGELSEKLNQSDKSLRKLEDEMRELTREKDGRIREIEETGRRIEELENAAQMREEELESIARELKASSKENQSLNHRIERLSIEVEAAKEERAASETAVSELEDALKESDDRTLKLSQKLDDKEHEIGALNDDLAALKEQLKTTDSDLDEVKETAARLKAELEEKLEAAVKDKETVALAQNGMISAKSKEIANLRSELEAQESKLKRYEEQRGQSVAEIEKLHKKLGTRGDSVRELQSEVSNVMMQRASRDNEVSLLKDKLRAVEDNLKRGEATKELPVELETELHASLSDEEGDVEGMSLDDLDEQADSHHAVAAPVPEASKEVESPKEPDTHTRQTVDKTESIGDDDHSIYFDETSADLTESGIQKIDEFARAMRRGGRKTTVTVIGFSGPEGTQEYAESLSARRADAVRERLLERGVSQALIAVQNSGQDRRFTNWRARRVELVQVARTVAETVN